MKNRIKIPVQRPRLLLDLAQKVHEKHVADGNTSALNGLHWEELTPLLTEALQAHERTEKLKRDLRESYQERGQHLDLVTRFLRDSRDILTGMHRTEIKKLGQWGFDVLEVRNNPEKREKGEVIM